MIRYLPVLFALLAGAIVQVILWRIPFRVGMIVFVSQLVLDLFAMAMLSFAFSFFVASMRSRLGGPRSAEAGAVPQAPAPLAESASIEQMRERIENLGAQKAPLSPAVGSLGIGQPRVAARLQVSPAGHRHVPLPPRIS